MAEEVEQHDNEGKVLMVTNEDLICWKEMVLKEGFSSYSPELTSYNKNKIIC